MEAHHLNLPRITRVSIHQELGMCSVSYRSFLFCNLVIACERKKHRPVRTVNVGSQSSPLGLCVATRKPG